MRVFMGLMFLVGTCVGEVRLTIAGKSAELKEAMVEARIHGNFLIRDLKLVFHNPGARVAEGDLWCSLDEGEEVISFAMDVNGKRRDAVVVPQRQARHAYETIVARGTDPGLLEVDTVKQEFRTRVFPIPAEGDKTVWIRTVRFLSAGAVTVWPQGLERSEKWELMIEAKGGVAGSYEVKQAGDHTKMPTKEVRWQPDEKVIYQGQHGAVHLAGEKRKMAEVNHVEIWLDGTVELGEEAIDSLQKLLMRFGEARMSLRVFRDEMNEVREFGADDTELLKAIAGEHRWGMARPEILPWKTVSADAVVLLTDGEFVFGRSGVGETSCPLHIVDAGRGKSRWLRSCALASGGGWHGAEGLDPGMGIAVGGVESVGEIFGEIFYVKKSEEGVKSPIGDWLWARLTRDEMKARGESEGVIRQFNLKHGVMDEGAAMIVLETARQYSAYGITPPESDRELYARWQALKQRPAREREIRLNGLAEDWKKRCELLAKPVPSIEDRIVMRAEARAKELVFFATLDAEKGKELVLPLQRKLTEICDLAKGGLEGAQITVMKNFLTEAAVSYTHLTLPTTPYV